MDEIASENAPRAKITRADATRIDDVGPLWKALHAHHQFGAVHLGTVTEFRSPDESWAVRRAEYLQFLAAPLPSALFLAEVDNHVVGYAMIRNIAAGPTLKTDDTIGHLESLAVLPDHRSAGLGRALLDAVWAVLREWGTTVITVNVMAGNIRNEQLYRGMGMVPFASLLVGRVE